jgi:magnesium transporter
MKTVVVNIVWLTGGLTMKIQAVRYSPHVQKRKALKDLNQATSLMDDETVLWIDISQPDAKGLKPLHSVFNIHPLSLEDVLETPQRPKVEEYNDYIFIVSHYLRFVKGDIDVSQLSVFLGDGWVITVHKKDIPQLKVMEKKIMEGRPGAVSRGGDALMYRIIDAIVDSYFPFLDKIEDILEGMDKELMDHPEEDMIKRIHVVITDLQEIRRTLRPTKEAMNTLERLRSPMIRKETMIYMRDVYDHVSSLQDELEQYREKAAGIFNTYLTLMSNRLNQIMKVLTIIATIFIPLTFITGLYGMNFEYMPEIGFRYSYAIVLAIMVFLGGGMLLFFWKKHWL